MRQVSLVFVVLHYMAEEDTLACVDSIRQYTGDVPHAVVIVDNASPDGSGDRLLAKYSGDPGVAVLKTEKNRGFARGNNTGISYAREHYDFDFCVVCNNDILLMEAGLYDRLRETYDETGFAVLGPMIFTKKGTCSVNPGVAKPADEALVDRLLERDRLELRELKNPLLDRLHRAGQKIGLCPPPFPDPSPPSDYLAMHRNVQLHGSFLVFSPLYFEKFDGFYSGTYLYNEERILHLLAVRAGLTTVYQPSIRIFHKEDASTDAASGSARQKRLFYLENSIASLEVLRDLIRQDTRP